MGEMKKKKKHKEVKPLQVPFSREDECCYSKGQTSSLFSVYLSAMESWRHMGAHFLDASSARSSYPLGFYLWEIWVKKPDLLEKFCICLCREPPGHYQPGLYFQLISRLRNSQTMQTGNTYTPEPPKGRMCLGIPRGASSSSPHSTAAVFLIESFAESTTFKSS